MPMNRHNNHTVIIPSHTQLFNQTYYMHPFRCLYMVKIFYVYILASQRNGTLYIGVTSHLLRRIWEHKNMLIKGFTRQYRVKTLVYYEMHATAKEAIHREKRLKEWKRQWKINLVESVNPHWDDLYDQLF